MLNDLEHADHLFAEGEQLIESGDFTAALQRLQAAWDVLPEPRADHELAVQILAAICDAHFFAEDWYGSHTAAQMSLQYGGSTANPFLRLRLGQTLYELGNMQQAAGRLVLAYLSEGDGLFEGQEPKYLDFVREQLAIRKSPRLTAQDALAVAFADAVPVYKDLSIYVVTLSPETDGWHVEFNLPPPP